MIGTLVAWADAGRAVAMPPLFRRPRRPQRGHPRPRHHPRGRQPRPGVHLGPAGHGGGRPALTYPSMAADPDGDGLTYALVQGPAGLAVDPATGAVT